MFALTILFFTTDSTETFESTVSMVSSWSAGRGSFGAYSCVGCLMSTRRGLRVEALRRRLGAGL